MAHIEELSESENALLAGRAKRVNYLCEQAGDVVALIARSRFQSSESLPFLFACREELAEFLNAPENEFLTPGLTARAHYAFAQILILAGNRVDADQHLADATRIALAEEQLDLAGRATISLGVNRFLVGNFAEANERFTESISFLSSETSDQPTTSSLSIALRNLAVSRIALGLPVGDILHQAVEVAKQSSGEDDALTLQSELEIDAQVALSKHLLKEGKAGEAKAVLNTAIALTTRIVEQARITELPDKVVDYRNYELALERLTRFKESLANAEVAGESLVWKQLYASQDVLEPALDEPLTMCGEFETQGGLVVPWFSYHWVQDVSRKIIQHVWDKVPVTIVVGSEHDYYEAVDWLDGQGIATNGVRFCFATIDSPWLRDVGPIVCKSQTGSSIWIDCQNVRDGLQQRVESEHLPYILERSWITQSVPSAARVEGGAIMSNGQGLTVCSSLVRSTNLEYGFSKDHLDAEIKRITGATDLVFLDPLKGETTQHVDMFMTFLNPGTVVVSEYPRKSDENARILDRNAERLGRLKVDGEPLNVVRIPMLRARGDVFYSYSNVIFANGKLLVPSYGHANADLESKVIETYSKALPNWEIVPVDCTRLVQSHGALHCLVSNLGVAKPEQIKLQRWQD